MGDIAETPADTDTKSVFHTRSYQQELLEESLRSNIIIALDTGSGKTHIAVLRIKHEVERETRKVRQCSTRNVADPGSVRFHGFLPRLWRS